MSVYAPDRSRWLWLAAGLGILVTWCASLWMAQPPIPERSLASQGLGPPRLPLRSAIRTPKAPPDPAQAYDLFVRRWKKGTSLQELQWIVSDFRKDQLLQPANACRRLYLDALREGLSRSSSQSRQAAQRLPEWPELSPGTSLPDELLPHHLADLLEAQKRLTWSGVSPAEDAFAEPTPDDSSLQEFPADRRRTTANTSTIARATVAPAFLGFSRIFPEPDLDLSFPPDVLPLHPAQLKTLLALEPERLESWQTFLGASDRLPQRKHDE